MEGDPRGNRLVSGKTYTEEPKNGGDIITTLDEFIQFSTEKHLETTVKKYKARSGQVIVMDPNTGEILQWQPTPTLIRIIIIASNSEKIILLQTFLNQVDL